MDDGPPSPAPGVTADSPAPDATPWVFRYRTLLIGAVFLLSAYLSSAIAARIRIPYASSMALDPRLQLGHVVATTAGAPVPQILAPTLLILAGMLIRTWGTSYLRGHVMLDKRLHTDRLIVAGPFRWCRNPLYLGNMLLAAGFGLYLPAPGLILAVLGMGIAVGVIANAEANALRATYGKEYEAYERAVPMFVPKPPAKDLLRGTPVEPDWRNGVATESWQLFLAAYLAAIALRLSWLALGLAVASVVGMVLMRRRHAARRTAEAAASGTAGPKTPREPPLPPGPPG